MLNDSLNSDQSDMQKYFSLALNQNDITARTINLSTKTVHNLNCIDDVIYYKSELGDNINVRNYGLVSERIFPDDIDTSTMSYMCFNITKEKIEEVFSKKRDYEIKIDELPNDLETGLKLAFKEISLSKEEINDFSIESLKKSYSEGKRKISKSYWAMLRKTNEMVWIKTEFRLIERKDTGEIIAYFFNRDLTDKNILNGVINKFSNLYFECFAAIFVKNGKIRFIDKENGVILMTRTDIALYEKLRYASEHDSLTGLFNREKVFSNTRKMIDEHLEIQFAFVQLDIERFKLYNSDFGEKEGNNLLKYVAKIIKEVVSDYPICTYGRVNADKFCFCIPYDEDKFYKKLENANERLNKYRQDYLLHFKMGVCIITDSSKSMEDINVKAALAAEKCRYNIKHFYEVYDDEEEKIQRREMEIIHDMHTAIDKKQFTVFLQPKVNLYNEKACGAEALVRWIHPKKGMIPPNIFIPVFEKNGFIADLDYYMWEQVCILLRKWIDEGKKINPVSVNVSRISLYNPNLVHKLLKLINKYGIAPQYLHLEITESAYMTNPSMMLMIIEDLHKAGFTILMDDFGSGYSSLNALKDFPIDMLKIDMNFLPRGSMVERSRIIISSVIHMAKRLGIKVIMEGVETQEQRDFLRDLQCDYIQGYFYSKPIPVTEYEDKYINLMDF
ncbi:MAG: bifunctional diguanylate cyclase/phosphodiesterase [Inconstantimicrobium porci]|uniref:putative bifunctional diguanylate cyclase/phosphodiesterase n=1 Tax=Inconstantimicrobium porci TaxID=2652291 RepID=UPI002A916C73|nr:bifunctional diguanylate cyclase/phosphodiesterase [Inconstantimicrobium porci]MDY5911838.1 bifunctional diguanylate cyclase/phosphodiesterase [Inconstantimicrobium porci]